MSRNVLRLEQQTYLNITWPEEQLFPIPHRQMTVDEFLMKTEGASYGMIGRGYESLCYPSETKETGLVHWIRFHYYPHHCVASAKVAWGATEEMEGRYKPPAYIVSKGQGGYSYVFRFWRVGCEHPHMETQTVSMHVYKYTCPDCGLTYSVDSS